VNRATTFGGLDADVTYATDELDARSIRHWSPSPGEMLLREINRHGPTFVRTENGTVVSWPSSEPLRPGCTVVDPHGVDAQPVTVAIELEGQFTKRDAIHFQLQNQAHELSVLPRSTGRVFFDGDDIDRETVRDAVEYTKPTGARTLSPVALLLEELKP